MAANAFMYEAVQAAMKDGEWEQLWAHRAQCPRRCWLVKAGRIRGHVVVISRRSKLSPAEADMTGRETIEPEVWTTSDGADCDDCIPVGCNHMPHTIEIEIYIPGNGDAPTSRTRAALLAE